MSQKRIILLGATGSIGSGSLDVIRAFPDQFRLVGVSAHHSFDKLQGIIREFSPDAAALSGRSIGREEDSTLPCPLFSGEGAIIKLLETTKADLVINGIAGSAGLLPSWTAVQLGSDLALANKETIVTAGPLILEEARRQKIAILPVDSEHSAIFHLLKNRPKRDVAELILTASGGPFRTRPLESLKDVRLEEALAHPTWEMGAKITIDSASMANKGLEVIEAAYLFSMDPDRIKVRIHPQSMVHSLIRTVEGSMYAQISKPDMKIPIQNAMTYPELQASHFADLDLADCCLEFFRPEKERFPLLYSAYGALRLGPAYPVVFNAADEIAVEAFSRGEIGYTEIAELVDESLQKDWGAAPGSIEEITELDTASRRECRRLLSKRSS